MTLLATEGLTRRYAGLVAVDEVDLAVPAHGVHAIIGPNGAGKTTLFNLLSGLVVPSSGRIVFDGQDVTALAPYRRAALGIARTFQNIRVFGAMTVLENVLTGLQPKRRAGLAATVFRLPAFRAEEQGAVAAAREALAMVGLADQAETRAQGLSYGDQRRLEIARAIVSVPRLLLLDEPAAGMNPAETAALSGLVRQISETGVCVLLVEHDMDFVMRLCDSVTVLNFGRRIFQGTPQAARAEPSVVEAYLGTRLAARLQARHA